jgi:hypothetical protein
MDFPIIDLLDTDASSAWIERYFHLQGLRCPHCQATREQARFFRVNRGSGLTVYRCLHCDGIYDLYSRTLFADSQLTPEQVVLLLRHLAGQAERPTRTGNRLDRENGA